MTDTLDSFAARHYGERAADYVSSAVHSTGEDLDEIEQAVAGRGSVAFWIWAAAAGHVSYRVAPHVEQVVACDVTPDMLDAVRRTAQERGLSNIATQQAFAESLPFENGSFCAVLCRFDPSLAGYGAGIARGTPRPEAWRRRHVHRCGRAVTSSAIAGSRRWN
jgi:hypothetical protein